MLYTVDYFVSLLRHNRAKPTPTYTIVAIFIIINNNKINELGRDEQIKCFCVGIYAVYTRANAHFNG